MRETKERGITLVALVITIIVLLILAGVAINLTIGDNGIFKKADESSKVYQNAANKEATELNTLDKELENLISKLTESKERNLVDMVKAGENCTDTACTNEEHLHIGDYVNYKAGSGTATVTKAETGYDENQVYTAQSSTTWRVLGLSENGQNVLLTSGSPIKKDGEDPYLVLQGAESWAYCEDTLDKICSIYNNSSLSEETRSMRIEDINRTVGVTVDRANNKVYVTSDQDKTNIDQFRVMGKTYTYKSGDYAPENYLGIGSKKVGDTVTGTAYNYSYENLTLSDRIYNMLFAQTTSTDKYAKSYWLASPGVFAGSSYAGFGPGAVNDGYARSGGRLFYSNGVWIARSFAVRPVVCLKSSVTDKEVSKIADQTEETWTTDNSDAWRADGTLTGTQGQVEGSEQLPL